MNVYLRSVRQRTTPTPVATFLALSALAFVPVSAYGEADTPSRRLLANIEPLALAELSREALERNPGIARAQYRAAAAATRAPQVRSLPDPVAAMSLFVLPPETRVGQQHLSASLQQRFPWFGKLALQEKAALLEAAAAEAHVETMRLDVLTEARRLFHELTFVNEQLAIQEAELSTLIRFERTAQTRYAAGTGLQQESVRIQAQITRAEAQRLELLERRASLLASLNTLRNRPTTTEIRGLEPTTTPVGAEPELESFEVPGLEELLELATQSRPEVAQVDARLAAQKSRIELSEKNRKPDVTLGLSYTVVGKRRDTPGRLVPPEDNGDDVLALTGSVNLPVRKQRLDAERAEAQALLFAVEEEKRHLLATIEGEIGDLQARIPLLAEHLKLLSTVLGIQAREALRSAETAYTTGELNAVDLLDAEVVLFDVEIAEARTRADWHIARAELERAIGTPLVQVRDNKSRPHWSTAMSSIDPPRSTQTALIALVALVAGIVVAQLLPDDLFGLRSSRTQASVGPDREAAAGTAAATLYTCPMHPEVLEDEPGVCPICAMDLVPVSSDSVSGAKVSRADADHSGHDHEEMSESLLSGPARCIQRCSKTNRGLVRSAPWTWSRFQLEVPRARACPGVAACQR